MADLHKLKPEYLKLIKLIRDHRIETLGKTGLIHIPKEAVDKIVSPGNLERMADALVEDEILGVIETKGKRCAVVADKNELIFNCRQTAERMQAYKRSLIIEGSLGIRVDDHGGNYYDMYRNGYDLPPQRLSDDEGRLFNYLVDHADTPIDRDELANLFGWTVSQISSRLNTIRRKLTRLGFSRDQTMKILPPYLRRKVIFRLV